MWYVQNICACELYIEITVLNKICFRFHGLILVTTLIVVILQKQCMKLSNHFLEIMA